MPNDFDILSNNIQHITKNIDSYIAQEANNSKEEIADLVVSQMDEGIRGDGKKIEPEYSKAYAEFKGFKTPNLKLEGDFHSAEFVEIKGDRMLIGNTDIKAAKLEDKYSNLIHKIAPKNEQNAADEIDTDNLIKTIDNDITKNVV